MSIAGVARELLVRYLETWTPAALHSARRATFAQAWSGPPDPGGAEAALRVFAEFADRLPGRRLTVVLVAPQTDELTRRVTRLQAELGTPVELGVHPVTGDGDERLPAALSAAGAAKAPLLAYLDTAGAPALAAVAAGRPAEVILLTEPGGWDARRAALREAGFPLTAGVELVDGDRARLAAFGTGSAKSLEAFKNALWAVDEYAGVRYRDPHDPAGDLLDISLSPHPGPLRRELLARLVATGGCSVTELRQFTMTDTVYRPSDTTRVLTTLLAAGLVAREPERGRLAGDVLISAVRAAGSADRVNDDADG
jgi:hypothetical protein